MGSYCARGGRLLDDPGLITDGSRRQSNGEFYSISFTALVCRMFPFVNLHNCLLVMALMHVVCAAGGIGRSTGVCVCDGGRRKLRPNPDLYRSGSGSDHTWSDER